MRPWPQFDEPELRRRLCLSQEEFRGFVGQFAGSVGRRGVSEEIVERAFGYPWARPASSFLLRGDDAQALDELPAAEQRRLVARALADGDRHALLAFGSNGSPEALALKFNDLPDEDRELLVLAGDLHDFDVGAAPMPTFYGSLPATLFPSGGARVRASLLLVSTVQLTRLTWSEISYFLGRLSGVRFVPDAAGAPAIDQMLGFASRWGALCIDDAPVAMAAIPATSRSASSLTQEELLGYVGARVLGAGARELVTAIMEDFASTALAIHGALGESVQHFASERWTGYVSPD